MEQRLFTLESELYLKKESEEFLSVKRVQLLENISIYGSMSKAAKASGITYKTAWAWIDKMNGLSPKALVQTISGGSGGGGTIITAYAKELICRFEEVQALHSKHLMSLQGGFDHLENEGAEDFSFSRLEGEILEIDDEGKRARVKIRLRSDDELSAQVPTAFIRVHHLEPGAFVSMLIESEAISVSRQVSKELSSRNSLPTSVQDIVIQGDGVILQLRLSSGERLSSLITRQSFEKLQIQKEDALMAVFKAYSITLLGRGEET